MVDAEKVCEEFDKLYNKANQKEDFFKFKKKILLIIYLFRSKFHLSNILKI